MWNSVAHCFRNYAAFRGRASRPEYWWFYLFIVVVNVPIYALVDVAPALGTPLSWLWAASSLSPFLAVMSRRLHDSGHSFWWGSVPFLALCPVLLAEVLRPQLLRSSALATLCFGALLLGFAVLVIRLIILLCARGDAAANRYGDPPATMQR